MIDNREKNIDRMGIEGRQAILPNESSTHEEVNDWSQGRERIPLDIIHIIKVNCNVDSMDPTTDFISVVFCSNSNIFNLSLLVEKLLLIISSFIYIKVGSKGKQMKKMVIRITFRSKLSLLLKYFSFVDKM